MVKRTMKKGGKRYTEYGRFTDMKRAKTYMKKRFKPGSRMSESIITKTPRKGTTPKGRKRSKEVTIWYRDWFHR